MELVTRGMAGLFAAQLLDHPCEISRQLLRIDLSPPIPAPESNQVRNSVTVVEDQHRVSLPGEPGEHGMRPPATRDHTVWRHRMSATPYTMINARDIQGCLPHGHINQGEREKRFLRRLDPWFEFIRGEDRLDQNTRPRRDGSVQSGIRHLSGTQALPLRGLLVAGEGFRYVIGVDRFECLTKRPGNHTGPDQGCLPGPVRPGNDHEVRHACPQRLVVNGRMNGLLVRPYFAVRMQPSHLFRRTVCRSHRNGQPLAVCGLDFFTDRILESGPNRKRDIGRLLGCRGGIVFSPARRCRKDRGVFTAHRKTLTWVYPAMRALPYVDAER